MDFFAFLVIAPIAIGLLIVVMRAVWSYKDKATSRSLLFFLGAVVVFLAGNIFEVVSRSESGTLLWVRLVHVSFLMIALTWVGFALTYSGISRRTMTRVFVVLLVIPILSVAILFSNDAHGLFWTSVRFFEVGPFLSMRGEYGPWFWINGAYVYSLLVSGTFLMIGSLSANRPIYRRHIWIIVIGAVLPIVMNLGYVFQFIPGLRKDFTPIGFALSGLAFYVGIHRYSFIRISPIAYNLILQDVRSGVLVMDSREQILECNQAAESMLDVRLDSIIGTSWREVPSLVKLLQGVQFDSEQTFERSYGDDAANRRFDITIRPVEHPMGRTVGTVVTLYDLTERELLVERTQRTLKTLEEQNNHLSKLQLELLQLSKLAIVGQLTAGMIHDLKNPLTFLQSAFNAARRDVDRLLPLVPEERLPPQEREEITREISVVKNDFSTGYNRILDSLQGLIALSRPTGTQEAKPAHLNEIVRTTLAIVSPSLRDEADVDVELADNLPLINCLPGELSNVVLNLLLNAVNAIKDARDSNNRGRGTITVRTMRVDDHVRLEIQDSGTGVPDHLRTKIFEPFFTTRPAGKGTGLGLNISRNTVHNRHGGALFIAPGTRNCFVMELPIPPDVADK